MKLVKLTAENFMRLVAVEITPDGAVVQISGRNGAGKSSILRALEAALAGKAALPADPVRHGAKEARIEVDLGDFIVTRTVKPDGTTALTVATHDGAKYGSPQKILDGLLSSLAFDPLAFSRMKPREQRDTLANLVGLSKMLAELDAATKADYDERTVVNRDLRTATARFEAMERVEVVKPVDVSATLAEIRFAREHNAAVAEHVRDAERVRREIESERQDIVESRAAIARLRAEIAEIEESIISLERSIAESEQILATTVIPESIDLFPLERRLEQAEAINAQHRAHLEREREKGVVEQLEAASQAITDRMTARDAERAAVIQAAAFPIPGIGLTEDGVTLGGFPLEQASSAEQLRLSAAIGMALNPKLRVMAIRDGSLLDDDSLRLLTEAANAEDFVILCEVVDTSGNIGIYIEEGSVKAINGQTVEASHAS